VEEGWQHERFASVFQGLKRRPHAGCRMGQESKAHHREDILPLPDATGRLVEMERNMVRRTEITVWDG